VTIATQLAVDILTLCHFRDLGVTFQADLFKNHIADKISKANCMPGIINHRCKKRSRKNKKTLKNVKNVDKIKKRLKTLNKKR